MKPIEQMFSVKHQDIIVGMEIFTYDDENNLGFTKYKVLEKLYTGNIIVLKCINLNLNINCEIKINPSYQRDIWTTKLQSNWRQM